MSIEHADFDGIERLALVLGGEIVSTFDTPADVSVASEGLVAGARERTFVCGGLSQADSIAASHLQ
jgi:hypothetical protein